MKAKYLEALAQDNGESSSQGPAPATALASSKGPWARQARGALGILFLILTKWSRYPRVYGCADGTLSALKGPVFNYSHSLGCSGAKASVMSFRGAN